MARSNGRGGIGNKVTPNGKYLYGEAEEIANRDKGAFQPRATSFKQIGPDGRGGNLNEPTHTVKSGNFKFGPPPT